jgi:outer membrane biosynthesis protein TonB
MRVQDRKRNLAAAGATACLYALAFLVVLLVASLTPASLASVPGTVIVDLGGPSGPPGEIPQGLASAPDRPLDAPSGAAPLPAASPSKADNASTKASIPEPPAKAPALPPALPAVKAPVKTAPPAPASAKTIPVQSAAAQKAAAAKEAAAQAVQARTAQEEAAIRAAAATAAEQAGPPKTRTFGSSSSSNSASATGSAPVVPGGTGSAPGVPGGTGTVTFRGSEMGNSLVTTFGASSGKVGRNLYEPIWMYMPLPKTIGESIYRNIGAKGTFGSYYQQSGSDWKLKSQIPVAQRSDVWNMLDSAGFDASTADFRTERKLSPVVLEFVVGPVTRNKVELVEVRLASSSGSSEVDEAVIFGFRRGAYFNKTGYAISGEFVYSFTSGQ